MHFAKLVLFLLGLAVAVLPPIIGVQSVSCPTAGALCRFDAQPELIGVWTIAFVLFCFQSWTSRDAKPQPLSSSAFQAFCLTIALVPVFIVGLIGMLLAYEGRGMLHYGAALIGVFVSGMAFILRTAIQAILTVCDHYETQTIEGPGKKASLGDRSSQRSIEAGNEKKIKKIDIVKINMPDSQKLYSKDQKSNSPPSYKTATEFV